MLTLDMLIKFRDDVAGSEKLYENDFLGMIDYLLHLANKVYFTLDGIDVNDFGVTIDLYSPLGDIPNLFINVESGEIYPIHRYRDRSFTTVVDLKTFLVEICTKARHLSLVMDADDFLDYSIPDRKGKLKKSLVKDGYKIQEDGDKLVAIHADYGTKVVSDGIITVTYEGDKIISVKHAD